MSYKMQPNYQSKLETLSLAASSKNSPASISSTLHAYTYTEGLHFSAFIFTHIASYAQIEKELPATVVEHLRAD